MIAPKISPFILQDGASVARFLSLGCILQDWQVAGENGMRGVVLGYQNPADYRDNPHYFGAVIGRVANRISNAGFTLDNTYQVTRNEGENHLHGGTRGLHSRQWQAEQTSARDIRFTTVSENGDEGYPGTVEFSVQVRLRGRNLSYEMEGRPDRATPINMSQHSYFNLAGGGDLTDHHLLVNARCYTPTDGAGIPSGEVAPLPSSLDFSGSKPLENTAIDDNYALANGRPAARLWGGGLRLDLGTDQPGLQVYTGAGLTGRATPLAGQTHHQFSGIALEPQGFPDAVNQPGFPSVIATPDAPYRHKITLEISDAEVGE